MCINKSLNLTLGPLAKIFLTPLNASVLINKFISDASTKAKTTPRTSKPKYKNTIANKSLATVALTLSIDEVKNLWAP